MEHIRNTYPPDILTLGPGEIRLFEIFPGEDGMPISGRFVIHSLKDDIAFDTLSYRWSDPAITADILVQGAVRFQVPSRLEAALQDLRSLGSVQLIWVDALCINQANIKERNRQIQMMQEIYSNASFVRILLDIDVDPEDPGIQKLADIDLDTDASEIAGPEGFWNTVETIGCNQYWERIWIQQEIGLANDLEIRCRRVLVPAHGLVALEGLILKAINELRVDPSAGMSNGRFGPRIPRPMKRALRRAWYICSRNHQNDFHTIRNPFRSIHQYATISEAFNLSQELKASDPRDKIFVLLNVVSSQTPLLSRCDYSLSLRQVCISALRDWITQSRGLMFLFYLEGPDRPDDFPSWLPDFRTPLLRRRNDTDIAFQNLYEANGQFEWQPILNQKDSSLRIKGFQVDTISIRHPYITVRNILHEWSCQRTFETFTDVSSSAVKLLRQESSSTPGKATLVDEDLLEMQDEPLFSTLTGKHRWESSQLSVPYSSEFTALRRAMLYPSNKVTDSSGTYGDFLRNLGRFEIYHKIYVNFGGNLLYTSERGSFGLGPLTAEVGDEIWVIPGCVEPVLLRPVGEDYIFVGVTLHHHTFAADMDLVSGRGQSMPAVEQAERLRWSNRFENDALRTITLR